MTYDVAIIGAGIAGMATALRLQAEGYSTIVCEAHGQVGGCAGFYRKRGFAFDVGATTLVDFENGGVGGEFLESIGLPPLNGEQLAGYQAWLPDRTVSLYRQQEKWHPERLAKLGNSPQHQSFWLFIDHLADVFWQGARRGVKLPMREIRDVMHNITGKMQWQAYPLARYLNWTMGDALRHYGLRADHALCGLLAMLIEDTVHSTLDEAPLINSALGITIRGAGLTRHQGGMAGFWQTLVEHYRSLGGTLRVGCRVHAITGNHPQFVLATQRGFFHAQQVVSTLPAPLTATLAPEPIQNWLNPYLERDADALGGAIVVFLGVPEVHVKEQEFTHHQLLQDYDKPLGNGNNMFISVSAADDTQSAPLGWRAMMISTHCELAEWQGLSQDEYLVKKTAIGEQLVSYAQRVYPQLGSETRVFEVGTPRTYAKFTSRPQGAVGGVRQTLANSNQNAIPYSGGLRGFWLAGDTTWPGLGTVACVLGSRLVADEVRRVHHTQPLWVFRNYARKLSKGELSS